MWFCRSLLPQSYLPNCRHPKKLQAFPTFQSQGHTSYTAPILPLRGRKDWHRASAMGYKAVSPPTVSTLHPCAAFPERRGPPSSWR